MATSQIIKTIKEKYPQKLVLIRIGNFYHAHGKDAYIMSYLFGYRLKIVEREDQTCGFPIDSILKIKNKLEEKNIDYVLLDKKEDYKEIEKFDNGESNLYYKVYEKSRKYVNLKNRIDNIYDMLIEEIEMEYIKEKIDKIEGILYE